MIIYFKTGENVMQKINECMMECTSYICNKVERVMYTSSAGFIKPSDCFGIDTIGFIFADEDGEFQLFTIPVDRLRKRLDDKETLLCDNAHDIPFVSSDAIKVKGLILGEFCDQYDCIVIETVTPMTQTNFTINSDILQVCKLESNFLKIKTDYDEMTIDFNKVAYMELVNRDADGDIPHDSIELVLTNHYRDMMSMFIHFNPYTNVVPNKLPTEFVDRIK